MRTIESLLFGDSMVVLVSYADTMQNKLYIFLKVMFYFIIRMKLFYGDKCGSDTIAW